MYVQSGKIFTATLIGVTLALGGIALLSRNGHKNSSAVLAQTDPGAQTPLSQSGAANETQPGTGETQSGYEDGYRAGYRDGRQDWASPQNASSVRRTSSVKRTYYPRLATTRVAGARYYARPRRGHSTRNMILTIAAPAAIGAGIGGIVRGGKGAGIGALIGGGGGALYHLIKHRNN